MSAPDVVRKTATGIELRVRLTPKAAHDRVDGIKQRADGAVVSARVRAVPEDGKANAALEKLLAEWIGVARGRVSLTGGTTSRLKTVAVTGDGDELTRVVEKRLLPAET